jgi:hypothetical protein
MNNIEKLEKHTGDTEEKPWLAVVYDDTRQPSEATLEAAKAEYKREHLDWQERDFNVIWVTDEHAKELTKRLLAGEDT